VGFFEAGKKVGQGVFIWPNGNRYVGDFAGDVRSGSGVFYWRDGTVYRGQFADNRMHGWGIKRQPEGVQVVQTWRRGELIFSQPLVAHNHCSLRYLERDWMFTSDRCINGMAHGSGVAASLDGRMIIPDGRFVLGQLVAGEVLALPSDENRLAQSRTQTQVQTQVNNR
jgi:hypothetical protein